MQLNEVTNYGGLPIDGYGEGYFRIAGERCDAPLAIFPSGVVAWSGLDDLASLLARATEVDVLFIGTGPEMTDLPPGFQKAFDDAGVGVEVTGSPGACRTYNVLLGEGRRVGIALLPV